MEDMRIFEEVEVDCNNCEAYWLNQCDGASNYTTKCVSYIPTKRVDIPRKIQALEKRINTLSKFVFILSISVILTTLIVILTR